MNVSNREPGEAMPVREYTLAKARQIICDGRPQEYGSLENNFSVIAGLWSTYLGKELAPHDVAAMMVLMKVARVKANPNHEDSWVDIAGYAGCGNEVAK